MINKIENTAFRFRYVLLGIITACYTIQYMNRVTINTLMPFISRDLGMNAAQIGVGGALMLLFYGPTQLLTGWICDKIGSKKMLVFSIIAWSIITAWLSEAKTVGEWYFRMALFGALVGTEFVPSARLIVRWFPATIRARAQSVLSWAWIVTPAWAPIVSTGLYQGTGDNWRMVFIIMAILGAVPLLLIIFAVHDRPEKCRFASKDEVMEAYEDEVSRGLITEEDVRTGSVHAIEGKAKSGSLSFKQIVATRGFVPLCFIYISAQLVLWGVMTWSAKYMEQVHHFKVMEMGVWTSFYFIGGAIGSFLSGWVSDKLLGGRRKPMIIFCFASMIPFILVLATLQQGVPPVLLLLTLTGAGFFSNMVWGPVLTLPADMFSVEVYGKAVGFVNCMAYMAASASPFLMGKLIERSGNYFWAWVWVACTAAMGVVASSLLTEKPRVRV